MKFQLVINMERHSPEVDLRDLERHTLEMVQMADAGGFAIVWAAEHHALELFIGPNPFSMLTWWAAHTSRIRLGTAVAVAPYWHPIRLAGEVGLLDLYSRGRVEFGIGSGAFQREFDRMAPGLKQSDGHLYMEEMLPVLKALWQGDTTHDGKYWKFPESTAVPKPLQKPHPPLWVAARSPHTYDIAVKNGCNILSWRCRGRSRVHPQRAAEPLAANPGAARDSRPCAHRRYDRRAGEVPVTAARRQMARFENLFKNLGDARDGFAAPIDLDALNNQEFDLESLRQNLMFGTPDEVIRKLKPYEALGVDHYTYCATFGLGWKEQKRSLELFIKEVMPAFAEPEPAKLVSGGHRTHGIAHSTGRS
jgi:alkanesulfonate monooxygenase SsuD/methylene tetrahydromethanopterin reductase-like flavin-dependent oxidoreductase (luciferase family)